MKIDTNHIAFTSLVNEVERIRTKGSCDGDDLADLVKELGNFFEHAGEAIPGSYARDLAEKLPSFEDTTDRIDALKSTIEMFLDMVDESAWDPEGEELAAWLDNAKHKHLFLLPPGVDREDVERILEAHAAMNSKDDA